MLDKDAFTRRAFLAGSTAALGFGGAWPAFAEVSWKKFAGTTLEVNLAKGPRGDLLQRLRRSSPSSPASRSCPRSSPSSSSGRRR